jgi:hypothetical protein
MITFLEYLKQLDEDGVGGGGGGEGGGEGGTPPANTTDNVQGLRTTPVVRRKDQRKLIRRNARNVSTN